MSKLDKILFDVTDVAYEAGTKQSNAIPTGEIVEACNRAKQQIKNLIRELVENRTDMNDFVEKVQAL